MLILDGDNCLGRLDRQGQLADLTLVGAHDYRDARGSVGNTREAELVSQSREENSYQETEHERTDLTSLDHQRRRRRLGAVSSTVIGLEPYDGIYPAGRGRVEPSGPTRHPGELSDDGEA